MPLNQHKQPFNLRSIGYARLGHAIRKDSIFLAAQNRRSYDTEHTSISFGVAGAALALG
jgi:hypothetical protein